MGEPHGDCEGRMRLSLSSSFTITPAASVLSAVMRCPYRPAGCAPGFSSILNGAVPARWGTPSGSLAGNTSANCVSSLATAVSANACSSAERRTRPSSVVEVTAAARISTPRVRRCGPALLAVWPASASCWALLIHCVTMGNTVNRSPRAASASSCAMVMIRSGRSLAPRSACSARQRDSSASSCLTFSPMAAQCSRCTSLRPIAATSCAQPMSRSPAMLPPASTISGRCRLVFPAWSVRSNSKGSLKSSLALYA